MSEVFRKFAHKIAELAGSFYAFAAALFIIGAWAVTGPAFGFSDTWQLVVNTGTTIITFLMVFLIQNTQNRDNKAIQAKLDELIVHIVGTDNRLVVAEDLTDDQLSHLKAHFERVAERSPGRGRVPAKARGRAPARSNGRRSAAGK